MSLKEADILLVEDSPEQALVAQIVFKKSKIFKNLFIVKDGIEAIEFLKQQGRFKDAKQPHIILLDLSLPLKDGREVLADIKADESLRDIPVIVLSTSSNDEDVVECYRKYANCYFTKPVDLDAFMELIECLEKTWFTIGKVPLRTS